MIRLISVAVIIMAFCSCGTPPKKKARSSEPVVFSAHCETKFDGVSVNCIDYSRINESQADKFAAACQQSDDFIRVFVRGESCGSDGQIGGCQFKAPGGIQITTWTYTSGEDIVDAAALDAAKETCENPTDGSDKGVWKLY